MSKQAVKYKLRRKVGRKYAKDQMIMLDEGEALYYHSLGFIRLPLPTVKDLSEQYISKLDVADARAKDTKKRIKKLDSNLNIEKVKEELEQKMENKFATKSDLEDFGNNIINKMEELIAGGGSGEKAKQ